MPAEDPPETPSTLARVMQSQQNFKSSLYLSSQSASLPISRSVLYKKGHYIAPKGYFIVEISTQSDSLFISANSIVSPDTFLLHLQGLRAQTTLRRFGYDNKLMAVSLLFKGDSLQLRCRKQSLSVAAGEPAGWMNKVQSGWHQINNMGEDLSEDEA
jgi:hypothetical protein